MQPDKFALVVRLRQAALDETRRHLAECLAAEEHAAGALSGAESEVDRQRAAAEMLSGDDAVVEAFATWLRGHRPVLEQVRAEYQRTVAETAMARAALAAARGALEAAEELHALRQEEARAATLRAEQQALDDLPGPWRSPQADQAWDQ
jgi:flagellar export protein FliJ